MKLKDDLTFQINGKQYTVSTTSDDVTANTTLNSYLRETAHLTGTKKMCMEGGCGSCIVAVDDGEKIFAVNSCLVSILSCQGWKIHTVEGIGGPLNGYHEIQTLLANDNGTQCGFCSPGMVMNMYALYESGAKTQKEIEDSFGGNICRCTGYRPILTAFKKFASDAVDIEDLKPCQNGKCEKKCKEPCKKDQVSHYYTLGATKWVKVYNLDDLLDNLKNVGTQSYMLVAGNTARGVSRPPASDVYIDVSNVSELTGHSLQGDILVLGGNTSLTTAMAVFNDISKTNDNFRYLATMAEHIDLIANVPVRNIGTIAGNLMIKYNDNSFPSDIFLILETFNATIVIVDTNDQEIRARPSHFLTIDMSKKVIKSIILNAMDSTYKYQSYKIMARAQNTHAHVNAGFLVKVNNSGIVESANVVYGAINPTFIHATNTETYLVGKALFTNDVVQGALKSLDAEIVPDHVLPEATPEFRKLLALSLFYKFMLNVAPTDAVATRYQSGGPLLDRPVSSGIQQYNTHDDTKPAGEPVIKIEALAQTSGQAEYIMDMPDLPHQLHAAFVTAKAVPNSTIVAIDSSKALQLPGVVAFYDVNDIPGENTYTPATSSSSVQEELFCSGRVQYYDQPIGVIVADNHYLAQQAAGRVEVTYTAPTQSPLLTIQSVLDANDQSRIHHKSTELPSSRGNDVDNVVRGKFHLGMQYHYHMETQCCNVVPTEDGLDLYPSSQSMDLNQMACSTALNIPMNKINVTVRRLGGAFGAKSVRNALPSTAAALAAYKLNRPVKIWMSMSDNMNIIGKRFPYLASYEVGVNDKGVIQYMEADLYTNHGAAISVPNDPARIFQNCYDASTWTYSTYGVTTDVHTNIYTRAPGTCESLGCIESIMEHIAYSIWLEPSDVKAANFNRTKHPKIAEFWDDMQTWGEIVNRKQEVVTFNQANRWKKRGLSLVPMAWTLEFLPNYSVLISIYHVDGSVVVSHGGIEMGQGINTKVAQVCAYKLGIPIDKVVVKPSYNVITPNSMVSAGSWTSEAVCYSVINACDELLARMAPVRARMGNPSWVELVNQCHSSNVRLNTTGPTPKDAPPLQGYVIYGVCTTEVIVDILTGQHHILRVDIIEDTGDSMNPLVDIGQVEGAFVMGLGYYTTEEIVFNDEGQLLTNRSWNYRPPGAKDIPINFRIKFPANNPNPVGVLKSKAVGEPPLCLSVAVPLAIRNAMASARGDALASGSANVDFSSSRWYPFDGPSGVENTLSNTLNDYTQYVLQ